MSAEQNTSVAPTRDPHADLVNRFFGRAIDTIIFGAMCTILPPFGVLAGFVYLLIADGLWEGRSLGKRIVGLRVVVEPHMEPAGIRDSVIRNLPMAFIWFLAAVPILGWLLLFTVGLLLLGVEVYLVVTEEHHRRAGDILARTRVIGPARPQRKLPDLR